jgi:hypothetical protein
VFRESNWLQRGDVFGDDVLELRLSYDDYIPSDEPNTDRRSELKHIVRLVFSDQLRKRWRDSPKLSKWKSKGFVSASRVDGRYVVPDDELPEHSPFFRVPVCGYQAVPLVSWHNNLGCELDVVFTGEGRSAIRPDGDLDNRLKTLFDALRMPLQENQVPAPQWGSGNDELFCLLEDDSLIRKFSVEAVEYPGSPVEYDVRIRAIIKTMDDYYPHPALVDF